MHQINSRLGQRIRLLRRAKGFTQEGLADTSGLNRSHLGEIERGEVDVTIATLARIGMALETSMPALPRGVAPRSRSQLIDRQQVGTAEVSLQFDRIE